MVCVAEGVESFGMEIRAIEGHGGKAGGGDLPSRHG